LKKWPASTSATIPMIIHISPVLVDDTNKKSFSVSLLVSREGRNTDKRFETNTLIVIEQPFNNYFLFCPCLLLFGFVDDIIKGQQHESDFISFYLCLSLFGFPLSLISLSSYLWLISYWRISGLYPIG